MENNEGKQSGLTLLVLGKNQVLPGMLIREPGSYRYKKCRSDGLLVYWRKLRFSTNNGSWVRSGTWVNSVVEWLL